VRGRKGEYKSSPNTSRRAFSVKIDGTFHELAEATLDKKFPHDIDVVVDRIVVRPDIGQRLAESFEPRKTREGLAVIEYADAPAGVAEEKNPTRRPQDPIRAAERILFSEKFACPVPVSPFGIEPGCSRSTTLWRAWFAAASASSSISTRTSLARQGDDLRKARSRRASRPRPIHQTLTALGKFYKFTLDTKWKDLLKKARCAGLGDDEMEFSYEDGVRSYDTKTVRGRHHNLERASARPRANGRARAGNISDIPCAACRHRLKPESLCVKIGGAYGEISNSR
jgi:excinuclease ABC subunit A